jgi:hypothetical protein
MAPHANWKGFLRLSLVSCPILLYPATSDAEKIRFNQINKATGHRIKIQKVDAEVGTDAVACEALGPTVAGCFAERPQEESWACTGSRTSLQW